MTHLHTYVDMTPGCRTTTEYSRTRTQPTYTFAISHAPRRLMGYLGQLLMLPGRTLHGPLPRQPLTERMQHEAHVSAGHRRQEPWVAQPPPQCRGLIACANILTHSFGWWC